MKMILPTFILLGLIVILTHGQEGGGRGAGPGGQVEPAVVPSYLFNLWLCRPGADQITVSVVAWQPLEAFIEYDSPARQTAALKLEPGQPHGFVLDQLKPDSLYSYHLVYRAADGVAVSDEERQFRTQRQPGHSFTFAIQADSHLDVSTDVRVYRQTLANIRQDQPDFMIDLGDTTMVDKFGSFYTRAESQYKAQRYYLGQVALSVPLFMVLGNHDGERGDRPEMAEWSLTQRKKWFPNPQPGSIYTGNPEPKENWYAWEWGDALFIVLDPFWETTQRRSDDPWSMTLGKRQYQWLDQTLANSRAKQKLVFIHHLVGGLGRDVRGGAKTAAYMEWGGLDANGSNGFSQNRPDWSLPIHALLVKYGVKIVFHGHDHLYVKEERDGIIYQEVPQPGHPSGGTRSAEEYGYSGIIHGSSGHLRVTVRLDGGQVDYVRSQVSGVTRNDTANGTIESSYSF